jgi:alkylated DNA repair dioxygenase AlkB
MLDLFADQPQRIELDGGVLLYYPSFLTHSHADQLLKSLQEQVAWQQSTIRIAGRDRLIPRLNAWYGDPRASYAYSGARFTPNPWLP